MNNSGSSKQGAQERREMSFSSVEQVEAAAKRRPKIIPRSYLDLSGPYPRSTLSSILAQGNYKFRIHWEHELDAQDNDESEFAVAPQEKSTPQSYSHSRQYDDNDFEKKVNAQAQTARATTPEKPRTRIYYPPSPLPPYEMVEKPKPHPKAVEPKYQHDSYPKTSFATVKKSKTVPSWNSGPGSGDQRDFYPKPRGFELTENLFPSFPQSTWSLLQQYNPDLQAAMNPPPAERKLSRKERQYLEEGRSFSPPQTVYGQREWNEAGDVFPHGRNIFSTLVDIKK